MNNDKAGNPSVGWTGANDMTKNAIKAAKDSQTGVVEVAPKKAQLLANTGQVVMSAAENSKGAGHIGIVAPSKEPYKDEDGPLIGQAGAENGIRSATKSYQEHGLEPKYFVLPK